MNPKAVVTTIATVQILIHAVAPFIFAAVIGPGLMLAGFIRLLVVVLLAWFLTRRHRWAQYLAILLSSLSAIVTARALPTLFARGVHPQALFVCVMSVAYAGTAVALLVPAAVRRYFAKR